MARDDESDYVSKAAYDALAQELEATKTALSEEMERAEIAEGKVKEMEPLRDQLTAAETGRRSLEAAREYDKIADELGVRQEFKDAVLKLMEFKPSEGDFDPKALREHAAKYLDANKQFTKEGAPNPSKLPKDPFSGRGGDGPADGDGGKVQVSRKDYARLDWRQANEKLIATPDGFELVD